MGRQIQRDILLVDGSSGTRLELRRLLEPLEHNIYEARTGKEALRLLSAQPVDLVLIATSTPDVDEFGFCNALRGYFRTRSLSVVLIAEPEHAHQEASAIAAGADEFLIRPLIAGPLLARVQAILRRTPVAGSDDDFASVLLSLAQAVEAPIPPQAAIASASRFCVQPLGRPWGCRRKICLHCSEGRFCTTSGKSPSPITFSSSADLYRRMSGR